MPTPALPREIKLGAKGRDVRAYQRALRKAGYRPKGTKTTNLFDAQMDAEVRAFQQAKGLLVDGEIGENTFGQLLRYVDAWGKRLLAAVKPARPSSIRKKIVASAFVGY
jgi:peptidoglycan hydrolase-like protein with peptidoglycan-binding domain